MSYLDVKPATRTLTSLNFTWLPCALLSVALGNLAKADCSKLFDGLTSRQLVAETPLLGRFELKLIEGHDDIYRGKTASGQEFIFRTNRERAKLEVSVFRFAKAAGFEVPLTTYADINGLQGSAQAMVHHLKLAADEIAANGFIELPRHRPNPETRVFDALLGINDRNPTNFFLREDGRQVLIDHEQAFYRREFSGGLIDGDGKALGQDVIQKFRALNPEVSARLADISQESNWLWALRDLTEAQRQIFRERLRLYRRLYREARPTAL
jgi:hypothetical protein